MRKLFSKSNEPEIQFFKKNIPSTDYRPLQPKKKEENDRRGKERHMLMTQFIQMTKFSVSFFLSSLCVCRSCRAFDPSIFRHEEIGRRRKRQSNWTRNKKSNGVLLTRRALSQMYKLYSPRCGSLRRGCKRFFCVCLYSISIVPFVYITIIIMRIIGDE